MIRVVRINNVGLPRSGKTSFMRRMMGEIENILAAYERGEKVQRSTGVAECCGQVVIRNATTNLGTVSSKEWSVAKDLSEEASMLNQFFYQVANPPPSATNIETDKVPSVPKMSVAEIPRPTTSSASRIPKPFKGKGAQPNQFSYTARSTLLERIFGFFGVTRGGEEISEMFSVMEDAMKFDDWKKVQYILEDTSLLISTDTGGQGEFLDLQASLVQGPSLNLLFSRLVDNLDSLFKVYFTNSEGVSTDKEDSTLTVEEVLFQALSSIACFGGSFSEAESASPADAEATSLSDHLLKHSRSKAMFIGTHLDQITPEEFQRKDQLLQQKLRDTEFYDKDIIEFASPDQLMIAVDNMKGDSDEINRIRRILERVIENNFEKIAIPAAWLMLSLHIRDKKCRTMSLAECQKLALKLRIKADELQDALWFLHHHVGVLLYYPEVKSLRGTVICEMQVVFDSATNLIKNTFTFDAVGQRACNNFKEKGQFSLDDVKTAMSSQTDSLIPLKSLVELLQHLGILTTVPTPSSKRKSSPTYFMPCVLRSARASLLNVKSKDTDPAPLMLRYECGYVPVGVFPALITNLVSQRVKGWKMIEEVIYKNKVQFFVGDFYDTVTLISHPRYFEIVITQSDKLLPTPVHSLCDHIRGVIESTLATVTSRMNYQFTMKYKFGFECPIHPGRDHLCILQSESAERMECLENPKRLQPIDFEPFHRVWFSDIEITPPIPTSDVSVEASLSQQSGEIPLSLKALHILKWKGADGKAHVFRLISKVSADWRKFGAVLGFEANQMQGWKDENLHNVEACWMKIMEEWLTKNPSEDYPATWEGLYTLLIDCEHSETASELKEAVKACS